MANNNRRTEIKKIGVNCETGDVDLGLDVILDIDGEEEVQPMQRLPAAPQKILPGSDIDQGIRELNDENAFWFDAPPIEATDVLKSARALLLPIAAANKAQPRETGRFTILNAVIIDEETGIIGIRFRLVVMANGVELSSAWHRTSIDPGTNPGVQIARVNDHLKRLKQRDGRVVSRPPVERHGIAALKDIARAIHTPDRVKQLRAAAAARSV